MYIFTRKKRIDNYPSTIVMILPKLMQYFLENFTSKKLAATFVARKPRLINWASDVAQG